MEIGGLFWVQIAVGIFGAVVCAGAGFALKAFFGEPALVGISAWLGISLFLGVVAGNSRLVLLRRQHWGIVGVIDLGSQCVAAAVGTSSRRGTAGRSSANGGLDGCPVRCAFRPWLNGGSACD